jgi:hypothetical protein
MIEQSAEAFNLAVNRIPELQSLLYDLNLMPETVNENTTNYRTMINIIAHFVAFEYRLKNV